MNPQMPPPAAAHPPNTAAGPPAAGPPAPIDPNAAAGVPLLAPDKMLRQTQHTGKKRKRMIDIDDIAGNFTVKPKDYEAAWNSVRLYIEAASVPGPISTLPPSSLSSIEEALHLFNLRQTPIQTPIPITLFTDINLLPVPQYLLNNIGRICSITCLRGLARSEAFCRTVLDQILISSLFEEGQRSNQQLEQNKSPHGHPSTDTSTSEDPARLGLLYGLTLSRLVTHDGKTKVLSGVVTNSVWYDNPSKKTTATSLLIIKTKLSGCVDLAMPQLVAYMGIVHATRKEAGRDNAVVYGAVTDGGIFRFCRIDNNGAFTRSRLLEWEFEADRIYSIMRLLLRAAALLSPSSTPIKDPMKRKIILEACGGPITCPEL